MHDKTEALLQELSYCTDAKRKNCTLFGADGPSVEAEERTLSVRLTKKQVMSVNIPFTVIDSDNSFLEPKYGVSR